MAGAAFVRRLSVEPCEILTATRAELDLRDRGAVEAWMADRRPDAVVLAAAKVGGIHANAAYPVEFLNDNLAIETNVLHAAHRAGVEKLLFLGSSCIYPREAPQPMSEDALLTGPLEPTNEAYAIAKIAGIKLCQAYRAQYGRDFIAVMPTNLYGPGDNYHPTDSHVVAALIRRFHEAMERDDPRVTVWGSGRPRREFLYVDDMADAGVFLLKSYSGPVALNVGTGRDISIAEFAETVKEVVGYRGEIVFDTTKPDGAPRKLLDISRIAALGWRPATGLRPGLEKSYAWFRAALASGTLSERGH